MDGDDGYPYAVPLSYVYCEGKIFFHGATSGHKLDAILKNDKVLFCLIDLDRIVLEKYTTYFRSVIVFGRAAILEADEKRKAAHILAIKYSPDDETGLTRAIDDSFDRTCLVEIKIEHMTGKEAIELVREKE